LDEKIIITDTLINYGLPLNSEGKNDYLFIMNRINQLAPKVEKKDVEEEAQ
jgi:hypothetical protein